MGQGRTSAGTTTLAYRETFNWDYGLDALVENAVRAAQRRFQEAYPRLPDEQRGQILGALRTRIWMTVDAGGLALTADDLDDAARGTAEQAVRILRAWYPDVGPAEVKGLVLDALSYDSGEEDFVGTLPGLHSGFSTSITVRVRMPGEVTESNASREEDGALVWDFEAGDTLEGPVEIRAESVVRGGERPGPAAEATAARGTAGTDSGADLELAKALS